MKQEPVAWQWFDTSNFRKSISDKANKNEWRPLYTEPPHKNLSDEEIQEIYDSKDFYSDWDTFRYKEFARAILKKASEK